MKQMGFDAAAQGQLPSDASIIETYGAWTGKLAEPNPVEKPHRDFTVDVHLMGGEVISLNRGQLWQFIMKLSAQLNKAPEAEIALANHSFKGLTNGDLNILWKAMREHPDELARQQQVAESKAGPQL